MARKSQPKPRITPENKCSFCRGTKCCTYITEALGVVRSKSDFEHLLWQVAHEGVEAYKDESGWYLLMHTSCSFLESNGQCGIYDERPQICRDYDNDFCEYDAPAEEGFLLHFKAYDELLKYCKKRFRTWGK